MCGIAGFVYADPQRPAEEEILLKMLDSIFHRGPDEDGRWTQGNKALGMRRLSIIDLSTGSQPLFNEKRDRLIVYNGEFYTYQEHRKALAEKYRFTSQSDTEVILRLYEEYGMGFTDRLRGMYAFALADLKEDRLILVRDRLGIKPLYYTLTPTGTLVFGSEIKALLAHPEVDSTPDLQALEYLLTLEYIPAPLSAFKSIKKLPAGHTLTYSGGRVEIAPYWSLEPETQSRSLSQWEDELESRLEEAVKMRLISDVPLGAFLSGGVDSSAVVAKMRRLGVDPLMTFSIGFDDPSYNELPHSQRVSDLFHTQHHTETLKADILPLLPRVLPQMDDPIGDFSVFPTLLVSEVARRHVTVSLSGDGGDEIFAGYEHYLAQKAAETDRRFAGGLGGSLLRGLSSMVTPSSQKKGWRNRLLRYSRGLSLDPGLRHFRWTVFLSLEQKRRLFTPEARKEMDLSREIHLRDPLKRHFQKAASFDSVNGELYLDVMTYLPDNILVKVDRMSMAVSLEARVPLLDHLLVETAFRIPGPQKLQGWTTKALFKKASLRDLPPETVYRRKEGFSIPMKSWLRRELVPLQDKFLSAGSLDSTGIFVFSEVEKYRREHLSGKFDHSHILWGILLTQMWFHRFILKEADPF